MNYQRLLLLLIIALYSILIFSPLFVLCNQKIGQLYELRLIKILLRTFFISTFTALTTEALSLPVALFLSGIKKYYILALTIISSLLIPPYIRAIIYLKIASILKINIYNIWGVIFTFIMSYYPYCVLLLTVGIKTFGKSREEVKSLYLRKAKNFFRILFCHLLPYAMIGMIFVFIFSLSATATPELFRINTYSLEVYMQFAAFHNYRAAVLISLPIIFITLFLGIILGKIFLSKPLFNFSSNYHPLTQTASWRNWKGIYTIILLSLSLFLPLGYLFARSNFFSILKSELTASWEEILNSIFISFITASLCLFATLFLAKILLMNKDSLLAKLLDYLTIIPFVIPAPVIALGLIKLTNRTTLTLYSSSVILILSYLIMFHPYSMRILKTALENFNTNILDSARLVIRSQWRKFINIELPLINPYLLICWLIVFLLAFQELSAGLILAPPGEATLAIKIESLMHYGNWERVFGLCILEVGIGLLLFLFSLPLLKISMKK